MHFWKINATALLTIVLITGQATAYELTSLGDAGGWKGQPVTTVLDRSDFTTDLGSDAVSLDRVGAAVERAFDTWANVSATDKLSFEQRPDNGGNYDVFDGGNGLTLDQSADWLYANITIGGWLDGSFFEALSPGGGTGILAVSVTSKLRGGGSPKPKWDSDIFFNDYFTWSDQPAANEFDIETVALHEIGHSLGLDHENDVDSVMASYYGGVQQTLFDDDLAGLDSIYGKGGGGGGGGGGGKGRGGNGPPNRNLGFGSGFAITGFTVLDGFTADFSAAEIPEPSTCTLALLSLGFFARSRRKQG